MRKHTTSFQHTLFLSTFLLLAFLSSCFEQCEAPFPPGNIIDKFRILAIKADPPELAPGETTTLSFLAALPNEEVPKSAFPPFPSCIPRGENSSPTSFWIACIPGLESQSSAVQCTDFQLPEQIDSSPQEGDLDAGSLIPGFELCGDTLSTDEREATLCLPFPPCGPRIQWKAPLNALSRRPSNNQTTRMDVTFVLSAQYKTQSQVSFKRITLSTKEKSLRNTNPTIQAMRINGKAVESCLPDTEEACTIVDVPLGQEVTIEAILDEKSQDPLPIAKESTQEKEDIQILWYATHGEFNLQSTIRSGKNPPEHSSWPTWFSTDFRGQSLKSGQIIRILAIAKDNRGGFDWRSILLKLSVNK